MKYLHITLATATAVAAVPLPYLSSRAPAPQNADSPHRHMMLDPFRRSLESRDPSDAADEKGDSPEVPVWLAGWIGREPDFGSIDESEHNAVHITNGPDQPESSETTAEKHDRRGFLQDLFHDAIGDLPSLSRGTTGTLVNKRGFWGDFLDAIGEIPNALMGKTADATPAEKRDFGLVGGLVWDVNAAPVEKRNIRGDRSEVDSDVSTSSSEEGTLVEERGFWDCVGHDLETVGNDVGDFGLDVGNDVADAVESAELTDPSQQLKDATTLGGPE